MAHVVSFKVAGLAGREEVVSYTLDRNVNLFFGLNGSGKTSLLKILHSAFEGDHDPLRRAAFTEAEVTIYSQEYDQEFVYRTDKASLRPAPQQMQVFLDDEAIYDENLWRATPSRGRFVWEVSPPLPEAAKGRWAHRYLPTWRLYAEPSADRIARGPREVDWDVFFAQTLEGLWTQYMSGLLSEVRRIQADGLANVLSGILSDPRKITEERDLKEETEREIYQRVSAFLRRQGSRQIGSFHWFQQRFYVYKRLRQVVNDIDTVERRIEAVLTPQTALENLITEMFSGNKRVALGDGGITVRTKGDHRLSLASLSAGEKQALRLLIETLFAKDNSLMVDEPEISLHIDWQHDLIGSMRQLNPDAQLIVATHSPEIMAEIDDSNIVRL